MLIGVMRPIKGAAQRFRQLDSLIDSPSLTQLQAITVIILLIRACDNGKRVKQWKPLFFL